MPKTSQIRERIIRLLSDDKPRLRRDLELLFDKSRRAMAKEEISFLISEGALVSIGTGRRGYPNMIRISKNYPIDRKCPLCLQEIPQYPGDRQ